MASKYNIDINGVRPNGNKLTQGVFVGNGVGNRESLFGVRGTGGGSVVFYDKVLYELEMTNVTNLEPSINRLYASAYTTTNKRTHGNNVVDNNLELQIQSTLQPYIDIPANISTASTQVISNLTVTQYDDAAEFMSFNGASFTGWTITQNKNYPTGITLTLNTPSIIPASGGSINSTTYQVIAHMAAGNDVDVTTDPACTMLWTGVTAISKDIIISPESIVGSLSGQATYVCNGYTVTDVKAIDIKQEENKIEDYSGYTITITQSTTDKIPASGNSTYYGTVVSTRQPVYTSTVTGVSENCNFLIDSMSNTTLWSQTGGTGTEYVVGTELTSNSVIYIKADSNETSPYSRNVGFTIKCKDNITVTATTSWEQEGITDFVKVTGYPTVANAIGSTTNLTISANTDWGLTSSETWATLAPSTGTSAVVSSVLTIAANTAITQRSVTITVSSSSALASLTPSSWTVTQSGATPYIKLSDATKTFSSDAGSETITVSANTQWTATSSDSTWLTVSPTATTGPASAEVVTITVTKWLDTTTGRTGTITFAGNGEIQTLTVKQEAATAYYVKINGTGSTSTSAGTVQNLQISANTPWTLTSSESWGVLSKTSGTGNDTATLTIAANIGTTERSFTVTVTGESGATCMPSSWTVIQDANAFVIITGTGATVGSGATAQTLSISANTSWILSSDKTWAKFDKTNGTGSDSVILTFDANDDESSRTVQLTASSTYCTPTPTTWTVTQDGGVFYIIVTGTGSTATSAETTQNLTISANTNWTLNSNKGWVTVLPTTGTSAVTAAIVTILANSDTSARTATVTVDGMGTKTPTSWVITQDAAPFILLSETSKSFGYEAGSNTVSISANTPWTATSSDSTWLTVSPTTSTGQTAGETLTISVTEWTDTTTGRTGTITISNGTISKTITVEQDKKTSWFIKITGTGSTADLTGSTQSLSISANTNWSLSSDQTWATLSKTSGTGSDTATLTITSNAASTSSRSVTITVGTTEVGVSIIPTSWSVSQTGNYPVSMTLTLNTPSDIPASGGSVMSTTYTAQVTMAAGSPKTVTPSILWTGVTAPTKGTTASSRSTAGTLNADASYTEAGITVTATGSITVYQQANSASYGDPYGLSVTYDSVIPAWGGSVYPTWHGTCQQDVTWTSTATQTITPTPSKSNNPASEGSWGTDYHPSTYYYWQNQTYTANGKTTTVGEYYAQQGNDRWEDGEDVTSSGELKYNSKIDGDGGSVSPSSTPSVSYRQIYEYTSGSHSYGDWYSASINYTTGTSWATVDGSGNVSAGVGTSSERTATINWSAKEKSGSASVTQSAYVPPVFLTAVTITASWVTDIPAAGGTATKDNCNYTVTAKYSDGHTDDVTSVATVTGSKSVGSSTITSRHVNGSLTLKATYSTKSGQTTVAIYQEAYVPPTPTTYSCTIRNQTGVRATCVVTASFGAFNQTLDPNGSGTWTWTGTSYFYTVSEAIDFQDAHSFSYVKFEDAMLTGGGSSFSSSDSVYIENGGTYNFRGYEP